MGSARRTCSWGGEVVVFSSVTSPLPNRCSRTLASRAKPAAPLGPGLLLMCLSSCAACHRTPLPVRQDAPASCMRYHTNPLSTSTMVSVCSRSHTLTPTPTPTSLTRPDSRSTRAETVFPQGQAHMTCNAGWPAMSRIAALTLPESRALRLIAQVPTQRNMPDGT